MRRHSAPRLLAALLVCAMMGLAAPSGAGAFVKAIWGAPYRHGHNQFPIYRQLGVHLIEADLDWANIAPRRPGNAANPHDRAYSWPRDVQQTVALARRFHMKVMLQVIGAPRWANGGHDWNWVPRPAAYATFTAAAARRYPTVHDWMIWGEPTRKPNFEPESVSLPNRPLTAAQKIAPHNYARILDAAYGALKAVSTRNLVVGGCSYTTGDIDTQHWIQNLRLPNGSAPRMDIYAHNPFGWRPPTLSAETSPLGEVMFSDLPRMARWIDHSLRRGMPIFLSEFTVPTGVDKEFGFYVDPPVQAAWIRQALHNARRWKRIWGLGWIHVYDDPPQSYGGLMTTTGVRKPGFDAFAHG